MGFPIDVFPAFLRRFDVSGIISNNSFWSTKARTPIIRQEQNSGVTKIELVDTDFRVWCIYKETVLLGKTEKALKWGKRVFNLTSVGPWGLDPRARSPPRPTPRSSRSEVGRDGRHTPSLCCPRIAWISDRGRFPDLERRGNKSRQERWMVPAIFRVRRRAMAKRKEIPPKTWRVGKIHEHQIGKVGW